MRRSTGYGTSPLIEETNHPELADAIVKIKTRAAPLEIFPKQLTLIRHYFEPARPASPTAVGNGTVP
jgi:hypothetical protein